MTIGINKEIKYIHFLKFKYLQNQQKYKQFIVKKFKVNQITISGARMAVGGLISVTGGRVWEF